MQRAAYYCYVRSNYIVLLLYSPNYVYTAASFCAIISTSHTHAGLLFIYTIHTHTHTQHTVHSSFYFIFIFYIYYIRT
jgi:hypothetical protein